MKPFQIGNWLIDQDGINWIGTPKYLISKETLTDSRGKSYDWLIHMPEKTWLTREDIYALNTAYVYAMEAFEIPYPAELSFIETFKDQEEILKNK